MYPSGYSDSNCGYSYGGGYYPCYRDSCCCNKSYTSTIAIVLVIFVLMVIVFEVLRH